MKSRPGDAVDQLRAFVRDPQLDRSVSRGEIYGMIVDYLVNINDNGSAVEVLKEMKINVLVQPSRFINPGTLQVSLSIGLRRLKT